MGNPMDVHVGSRVRLLRLQRGISQEKLAEKLELTFQQVQKYEKGANRISAGRLFTIADFLGAPISFFFDGGDHTLPQERAGSENRLMDDFMNSRDGARLALSFSRIADVETRRRIVLLTEQISEVRASPSK